MNAEIKVNRLANLQENTIISKKKGSNPNIEDYLPMNSEVKIYVCIAIIHE